MKRQRKVSKLESNGRRIPPQQLIHHVDSWPGHGALQIRKEFQSYGSVRGSLLIKLSVISDMACMRRSSYWTSCFNWNGVETPSTPLFCNSRTAGANCAQNGHWKSENGWMVTARTALGGSCCEATTTALATTRAKIKSKRKLRTCSAITFLSCRRAAIRVA